MPSLLANELLNKALSDKKINFRLNLKTRPAVEPVSLDEAKTHLRVDDKTENKLIDVLITVARKEAELVTRRAFANQTWQMFLDRWPEGSVLELPFSPLSSVVQIQSFDDSGSPTIFATSNYHVFTYLGDAPAPGRIVLKTGATPPIATRSGDGVEIEFVAGYGANACDIPEPIRNAILEEITFRFENRGDCSDGIKSPIAKAMLNQFKVMEL